MPNIPHNEIQCTTKAKLVRPAQDFQHTMTGNKDEGTPEAAGGMVRDALPVGAHHQGTRSLNTFVGHAGQASKIGSNLRRQSERNPLGNAAARLNCSNEKWNWSFAGLHNYALSSR